MKRKLLSTMVVLLSIVGVQQVNAYTVSDLESAGWVQVKSESIADVSGNLYVLVDAGSKSTLMASPYAKGRPYYKTVDDPLNNPLYVWTLEGSDNTFTLQNFATKYYVTNPANGWDTSAFSNEGETYIFTLNGEKYDITSITARDGNADPGSYLGPWDDDKDGVGTNSENIAGNKDISAAPGFLLYSISYETFYSQYYEACEKKYSNVSLEGASDSNPIDVTSFIYNADFSLNNGDGWIRTWNAWGNQQFEKGTIESWNCTDVSVTQSLLGVPNGIYTLSVDMISAPDREKEAYVYAKGTAEVIGDVVSVDATTGDYTQMSAEVTGNTLKTGQILVSNNELTVGIKVPAGWIVADNFKLYYLGTGEDAVKGIYEEAVKEAQALLDNPEYAFVTGKERSDLESAIASTPSDYTEALSELGELKSAFTAAKESYEKLDSAKKLVADRDYPYASTEIAAAAKTVLEAQAESAEDAVEKAEALLKAYRQLAESSAMLEGVEGAIDMTELITNPVPQADNDVTGWTTVLGESSGGSIVTLSNQPWTDGNDNSTHRYFDGGDWGAAAWDVTFKQEIELPAGHYQLSAMGRSEVDVTMTLFAGEETAVMANISDQGGLFNRGWEQTSVEFELEEASVIAIGVQGVTSVIHNWMSFSDFRLVAFEASVSVEVSEAGYATFSSEYPLDLSGVDAYIVTKQSDGETVTVSPCKQSVPANTGLIIAGEGEVTIPLAAEGTPLSEKNYLVATDGGKVEAGNYVFASSKTNPSENVGFYVLNNDLSSMEPNKAYLSAAVLPSSEGAKVLRIVFGEDNVTAIEAVGAVEADGILYNVAGQQVGKDYKGIVIDKNGKKYLNK